MLKDYRGLWVVFMAVFSPGWQANQFAKHFLCRESQCVGCWSPRRDPEPLNFLLNQVSVKFLNSNICIVLGRSLVGRRAAFEED